MTSPFYLPNEILNIIFSYVERPKYLKEVEEEYLIQKTLRDYNKIQINNFKFPFHWILPNIIQKEGLNINDSDILKIENNIKKVFIKRIYKKFNIKNKEEQESMKSCITHVFNV